MSYLVLIFFRSPTPVIMAEDMITSLLDGKPLETEEFCDFSLEEQNEAIGEFRLGMLV